jgi:hypothetical protein
LTKFEVKRAEKLRYSGMCQESFGCPYADAMIIGIMSTTYTPIRGPIGRPIVGQFVLIKRFPIVYKGNLIRPVVGRFAKKVVLLSAQPRFVGRGRLRLLLP